MKRLAIIAVAVTVIVWPAAPSQADHPWRGGIHWPTGARTLTVVDRTGDTGWSDAVRLATTNWDEVGGDHYTLNYEKGVADCGTEDTTVNADTHHAGDHLRNGTRISVCTANVTDSTAYAFAATDGAGHITGGYVLVRRGDYSLTARRHVMAHELGHLLGLGHTDAGDSVMGASWSTVVPSPHDCEQVHANAHHNDDGTVHPDGPVTCGPFSGGTTTTSTSSTTTTTAPKECRVSFFGVRLCS